MTHIGPRSSASLMSEEHAGKEAARRSLLLLWWAPISPIVGFVVTNRLFGENWPRWQWVPLALLLAAPFIVGAIYGLRAARLGQGRGWIGLTLHLALALTAVILPITEFLT